MRVPVGFYVAVFVLRGVPFHVLLVVRAPNRLAFHGKVAVVSERQGGFLAPVKAGQGIPLHLGHYGALGREPSYAQLLLQKVEHAVHGAALRTAVDEQVLAHGAAGIAFVVRLGGFLPCDGSGLFAESDNNLLAFFLLVVGNGKFRAADLPDVGLQLLGRFPLRGRGVLPEHNAIVALPVLEQPVFVAVQEAGRLGGVVRVDEVHAQPLCHCPCFLIVGEGPQAELAAHPVRFPDSGADAFLLGLVHAAFSLPFGELAVVRAYERHSLLLLRCVFHMGQAVKEDEVGIGRKAFLLNLVAGDDYLRGAGIGLYVETVRIPSVPYQGNQGVQCFGTRLQVYKQLQPLAARIHRTAVLAHHVPDGVQIHALQQPDGVGLLAVVRHHQFAVDQPDVCLDGGGSGLVCSPEGARLFVVVVRMDACYPGRCGQGARQQKGGQGNAENQCGYVHNSEIFYANLGIIRKTSLKGGSKNSGFKFLPFLVFSVSAAFRLFRCHFVKSHQSHSPLCSFFNLQKHTRK